MYPVIVQYSVSSLRLQICTVAKTKSRTRKSERQMKKTSIKINYISSYNKCYVGVKGTRLLLVYFSGMRCCSLYVSFI